MMYIQQRQQSQHKVLCNYKKQQKSHSMYCKRKIKENEFEGKISESWVHILNTVYNGLKFVQTGFDGYIFILRSLNIK